MLSTKNLIIAGIAVLVLGVLVYFVSPAIIPAATQPLTTYFFMLGAVFGLGIAWLISLYNAKSNQPVSIFVGNLPFKANNRQIQNVFAKYGYVHNVRIMMDKATRKPRGYGFVEMGRADAAAAINALNGYEFMGRELKVNVAENKRQDTQN